MQNYVGGTNTGRICHLRKGVYTLFKKKKKFNSSSLNSWRTKTQLGRNNKIMKIFFCKHIYFVHICVLHFADVKKNEISSLNKRQLRTE